MVSDDDHVTSVAEENPPMKYKRSSSGDLE